MMNEFMNEYSINCSQTTLVLEYKVQVGYGC